MSEEIDTKFTLEWLRKKTPLTWWLSVGGILFTTFSIGITIGGLDSIQTFLENSKINGILSDENERLSNKIISLQKVIDEFSNNKITQDSDLRIVGLGMISDKIILITENATGTAYKNRFSDELITNTVLAQLLTVFSLNQLVEITKNSNQEIIEISAYDNEESKIIKEETAHSVVGKLAYDNEGSETIKGDTAQETLESVARAVANEMTKAVKNEVTKAVKNEVTKFEIENNYEYIYPYLENTKIQIDCKIMRTSVQKNDVRVVFKDSINNPFSNLISKNNEGPLYSTILTAKSVGAPVIMAINPISNRIDGVVMLAD